MEDKICNCLFKINVTKRILQYRKEHPEKAEEIDALFGDVDAERSPFCCIITWVVYFAYCEECTLTVSELARRIAAMLLRKLRRKK